MAKMSFANQRIPALLLNMHCDPFCRYNERCRSFDSTPPNPHGPTRGYRRGNPHVLLVNEQFSMSFLVGLQDFSLCLRIRRFTFLKIIVIW